MTYALKEVTDNWEFYTILTGSMVFGYVCQSIVGRFTGVSMKQDTIDLLTEGFTGFIEDEVGSGRISRAEATESYRRLKQLFPTRELYPSVNWLKEKIQKRRMAGIHEPVPLPPDNPVRKKKHAFDKA